MEDRGPTDRAYEVHLVRGSFKSENDVHGGMIDCKVRIHFFTFGVLMYNTIWGCRVSEKG